MHLGFSNSLYCTGHADQGVQERGHERQGLPALPTRVGLPEIGSDRPHTGSISLLVTKRLTVEITSNRYQLLMTKYPKIIKYFVCRSA